MNEPMDRMEENVETRLNKIATAISHWVFDFISNLEQRRKEHDLCEVCHELPVTKRCYEGCGKRICEDCESFYYKDATICTECRNKITPEEEAEMRNEGVLSLLNDCLCGMEGFLTCDLTDEEHEIIREYKAAQVKA